MQYLDFQANVPVFVKSYRDPIHLRGKVYTVDQHFPWQAMGLEYLEVRNMFLAGLLYHNEDLEVKNKVGDGLAELEPAQLELLVDRINSKVKELANSSKEFNQKKCKKSRIADKQRGLLRSFLRNNDWVSEYYQEQLESLSK